MKTSKLIIALAMGLLLAWISVVFYLYTQAIANDATTIQEQALISARMAFEKDLAYRRWAAQVGGVYAETSEALPPNPYLDLPERDLATPSGKRLTLVNPAYMTRMVNELMTKTTGLMAHITSLRPIRPGNAPDAWETQALHAFVQGGEEASEIVTVDGKPLLRFMRPLVTEAACLKCHGKQGYTLGQIHGGISVTIPMAQYQAALSAGVASTKSRYLLLCGLGVGLICSMFYMMLRHDRFRIKAQIALLATNARLNESDARLRTLIDTMPDIVCFKDGQGRWLEANTFDLDLFALTGLDYRGKTDAELAELSPLFREAFLTCEASDKAAWAAAAPCRSEETIPRLDESPGIFDIIKIPTFHADGSRKGLVVIGCDITERKRVEQERQLAYERTQALLQLDRMSAAPLKEITDFTVEKAVSLTRSKIGYLAFLDGEETVLTMHSWNQAAMAACTVPDVKLRYPVAETGLWGEAIRQRRAIITNDYAASTPLKRGLPPGHVPIGRHANVPLLAEDRIVALAGVGNKEEDYAEADIQQITLLLQGMWRLLEGKRAEEELRRAEALMRAMLVNLPLDFWARNPFGRIIIQSDINRANWGDLTRPSLEPAIPTETLARWQAHNIRALTGEKVEAEAEHVLPDGSQVYLHEIVAPIRDREETLGIMGVNVDLTEHRRMERELRDARDTAEAANRAKTEFLANMSHEIRTPLNGILGMLQLLGTTELAGEQQEFLQAAIKSSNRLTQLLSDILDLSKIEAGMLSLHESLFEMASLRQSVLDLFLPTAKEQGLQLEFSLGDGLPPWLVGDEMRIRQILFNLVGNALKFTPRGRVTVEASPLPPRSPDRLSVLFTVDDTGIGIPDHLLATIFEPFKQAEGSYTRRFQGAGLGLSIVRKLVAMMDGELAVDSREGAGTTMYLTLRLKLPGAKPFPVQVTAPRTGQPFCLPHRILLADDDEISLLSGKRMLEKYGHAVTTARDGQEALELVAARAFDLVLMDVQMPVLDGDEAVKRIRARESATGGPRLPIVALTAYAMAGDRERFLAAGMDDYLSKPIDMEGLRAVIERIMTRNGGAT